MTKLSSNSTPTIKGIIYQFLIALEKCFEMKEGETVYIETFGDISLFGKDKVEQIESKFYKDDLTDLDHNVWKTLKNWMHEDFPLDSFTSLVLFTTQKIKKSSIWFEWNNKTISEKTSTLKKVVLEYSRKRKKDQKTEVLLGVVLNAENARKLDAILKKFFIDSNTLDDQNYYNSIKDQYTKHIPKIRRDEYIRSMLGYIICPTTIMNNNWEISFEEFAEETKNLSQSLIGTTAKFPEKIKLQDIKPEDYHKNEFVEKIKQIEYDSVIVEAISNFVQTKQLIAHEIRTSHSISDSLKQYEENIQTTYDVSYRKACRKHASETNKTPHSQDFYDEMMLSDTAMTFHIYNSIPRYFHNGLLHIFADEGDLIWLLK